MSTERESVRYHHRYRNQIEEERIPGEGYLRWLYEGSITGQISLHVLVKRAIFSAWYARKMNHRKSRHKVISFIADYDLDVEEFAKSPWSYNTFNEFFYRALKPSARPIHPDADSAVFPADGRHLVFPNIAAADGFFVKGQKLALDELLGGQALARQFSDGAMLISRLCPSDYHRFHFPVAGTAQRASQISGNLFSVNPIALRKTLRYLVENRRQITRIDTPHAGTVLMIEIGATMVGGIFQSYRANTPLLKGAEKGQFSFGGSMVITLFEKNRIRFDDDLLRNSAQHLETYAKMGDHLGRILSA